MEALLCIGLVLLNSAPEAGLRPPAESSATLRGQVRARGSRRGIPYAVINSDDGAQTETDAEGLFELRLHPGPRHLKLRAPGFLGEDFDETLTEGSQLEVRYSLMPASANPFETVVRSERSRTELGRFALRGTEQHEVAGTGGDTFKAVMLMPGVSSMVAGVSAPVVRGSNPSSTPVFLDGIRVPNLFHVFIGPSVVHPNFIDGVDFYAGGAPTEHGRLIGGAIEGHLSRPERDGRAVVSADLLSSSAFVELPTFSTGTSVTLAGRYSYTQPLLTAVGKLISPGRRQVADFWDYQGRVEQKLLGGTLRLFAFGSSDTFGSDQDGTVSARSTMLQTQRFHRVDLRYQHALGPGTAEVAVTVGEDDFHFYSRFPVEIGLGRETIDLTYQTDIEQLGVSGRARWDAQLTGASHLSAGVTFDRINANWVNAVSLPSGGHQNRMERKQPPAAGDGLGGWVEARFTGIEHLSVSLGVRFDAFQSESALVNTVTRRDPASAEPRLAVSYGLSDAVSIHASAGLYHQPPSFLINLPVVDLSSASFGLQEVVQTGIGATWKPWGPLELTAEFYVDPMLRLIEYTLDDDEAPTAVNPFNPGVPAPADFGAPRSSSGLAYGAELMIRWPLTARFFGWLTASVQRSTRWEEYLHTDGTSFTDRRSGELPYAFDQTFVANAVLGYRFGHGISAGTTLHFNTGRPESGQFGSRTHLPSADGSTWLAVDRKHVGRLPPYFRADVRVSKTWLTQSASVEAFVDVLNFAVVSDVQGYDYNGGGGQPLTRSQQGVPIIVPSVGLKATY